MTSATARLSSDVNAATDCRQKVMTVGPFQWYFHIRSRIGSFFENLNLITAYERSLKSYRRNWQGSQLQGLVNIEVRGHDEKISQQTVTKYIFMSMVRLNACQTPVKDLMYKDMRRDNQFKQRIMNYRTDVKILSLYKLIDSKQLDTDVVQKSLQPKQI